MTFKNLQWRKSLAYFWETYINWQYYLLVCPFRLDLQPEDHRNPKSYPHYLAKSWLPQKILCAFFTILYFPQALLKLLLNLPTNAKDPSKYFAVTYVASVTLYEVTFIKIYWMRQADITGILNFLLDPQNTFPIPASGSFPINLRGKYCFHLFRILNMTFVTGHWLHDAWVAAYPNIGCHLKLLWSTMVTIGSKSIPVLRNVTDHQRWIFPNDGYPFTIIETFLGVFAACGNYSRIVLYSHVGADLIILTATLQAAAKAFGSRMTQHSSNPLSTTRWKYIKVQYRTIKQLAILISQVLGSHMTLFLLQVIVYYSVSFDKIFIEKDFPNWVEIVPVSFYCANNIVVLWITGDISVQVRTLNFHPISQCFMVGACMINVKVCFI